MEERERLLAEETAATIAGKNKTVLPVIIATLQTRRTRWTVF